MHLQMDKGFEESKFKIFLIGLIIKNHLLLLVEHCDGKKLKTKIFIYLDEISHTFTWCTCRCTKIKTNSFRTTYNTFMFRPPGSMFWMITDC
jgi:hypothetical protein